MKLAALLLAPLAPLAAAQDSIVRDVVAEITSTDQDLVQGAYTRDLATSGGPLPSVPGLFGDVAIHGVRPLAVRFDFESSVVVRASLTNWKLKFCVWALRRSLAFSLNLWLGQPLGPSRLCPVTSNASARSVTAMVSS